MKKSISVEKLLENDSNDLKVMHGREVIPAVKNDKLDHQVAGRLRYGYGL